MRLLRKKDDRRIWQIMAGFLVAVLCFYTATFSTHAANEKVISSKADDQNVYLYVKGVSNITGGTVQIGNAICQNVSVGGLSAFTTPLRTVILIDNSQSIKKDKRPDIQTILNGVVDNRMEGEEFRIGTFSNSVTWLCDYTIDYEMVHSTLDAIEYKDQNSYFSDSLYEVLEDMSKASDGIYSRIIIVADGADDHAIGYTNSEVTTLIERCRIPVYTIGTLGDNKALETMFSFSRASKADYYLLDGSVSNDDIIASLLEDYQLVCIRITPDAALLDGGQKSIQTVLQTGEGEVTVTATVDMPFASSTQASENSGAEEKSPSQEETQPSDTEKNLPALGNAGDSPSNDKSEKEESSSGNVLFLIIGIIASVIVMVGVLLFFVLKKKKTGKKETPMGNFPVGNVPASNEKQNSTSTNPQPDSDKTMFVGAENTQDSDATISLWDQLQPQQETRTYLVLRDTEKPAVMFKVPIQDVVRIGRKNADIVIDYDKFISSNQCEIIKRGALLYIKDLGSANGTFYENVRIYDQETPIVSGGTIQIGKSKFTITIIME